MSSEDGVLVNPIREHISLCSHRVTAQAERAKSDWRGANWVEESIRRKKKEQALLYLGHWRHALFSCAPLARMGQCWRKKKRVPMVAHVLFITYRHGKQKQRQKQKGKKQSMHAIAHLLTLARCSWTMLMYKRVLGGPLGG